MTKKNTKKNTVVLSAQDTFAKNIVLALRNKTIAMKAPASLKTADASGTRYASVKTSPGVTLDVLKAKEAKNPRYIMTVSFPGSVKGTVNKANITGKYARLAYKALTKVPKVRKVTIPEADLAMANKAFGF
jgi:hypothetical protein